MKKNNYYNHKGEVFRIKIDDFNKIEELGYAAGKYLTLNQNTNAWELSDSLNNFNKRTEGYTYQHKDNFGEVDTYSCIAWSLGYLYTQDEYLDFMDKSK